MAEIMTNNSKQILDYSARDYDSILASMRSLIPNILPEWKTFSSEADFGNVLLELFAHMGDILSYYQDQMANESFLSTAQARQSVINHLRLIGYRMSTAAPASAVLSLTVASTRTDKITISKGNAFATKSSKDKASVRFEYTAESPLEIDWSTIAPNQSKPSKKTFFGIPVEEGRLIKNELLGVSTGKPNQRFPLAHKGLILRSLGLGSSVIKDIIILLNPSDGPDPWNLHESLAFSRENQRNYSVEIDDQDYATIIFGDGAFGAIPPTGSKIYATYRVGGGLAGNVPAGSIQTIIDAPQLSLIGGQISNASAATGGSDRETIDHAVKHAPLVFRSLKRAVTTDDYEALALDFKGVGKVRAEATNWNLVQLFIAPEGGGDVNDILHKNLLSYFEDKRPVTTIIKIRNVTYVKIYVQAEIKIERNYREEDVIAKVQAAVNAILAFDNVDFNQIFYLSKFYEAIETIDGVNYATITEFRSQFQPAGTIEPHGKINLDINEIGCIPDDPNYASGIALTIINETADE